MFVLYGKQNEYQKYYDITINSYKKGKLKEARSNISKAIEINATDSAYLLRAKYYMYDSISEKDCSHAIALNPQNCRAYINRGFCKNKEKIMIPQ